MYVNAVETRDAEGYCALLGDPTEGCAALTRKEFRSGDGPLAFSESGKVRDVKISGGCAKVTFEEGGFMNLREADGDWLVGCPESE